MIFFPPNSVYNNDVETELTDQYAAEWNKLDMDQTDYGMLRAWGLLDESIYTSEKMDEIASVRKSYSESLCHSKEYIVEKLKSRNYKKRHYSERSKNVDDKCCHKL